MGIDAADIDMGATQRREDRFDVFGADIRNSIARNREFRDATAEQDRALLGAKAFALADEIHFRDEMPIAALRLAFSACE